MKNLKLDVAGLRIYCMGARTQVRKLVGGLQWK